ncbi:MAG TPA: hypothetical protein VIC87_16375 [Vicinamibacteria bacterium]
MAGEAIRGLAVHGAVHRTQVDRAAGGDVPIADRKEIADWAHKWVPAGTPAAARGSRSRRPA